MTILSCISEGVGGVSGNVLYSEHQPTNQPCAVLCKAAGSPLKVVMFGASGTQRLAS